MKVKAQMALVAGVVLLLSAGVSPALIQPISGVEAGSNGSPPYALESVTVDGYTVTREFLATGTSTGEAFFLPGGIGSADDFDLNSVATRDRSGVWRVTHFGGMEFWQDSNGEDPDFFLFEAGMDDDLTIQAVLPGGVLGQAVAVPRSAWGYTGLDRFGIMSAGQPIGGVAFSITDLLDADGNALGIDAMIEGIQINSESVDPVHFSAVVPEPATVALLGLGALLVLHRRKR